MSLPLSIWQVLDRDAAVYFLSKQAAETWIADNTDDDTPADEFSEPFELVCRDAADIVEVINNAVETALGRFAAYGPRVKPVET